MDRTNSRLRTRVVSIAALLMLPMNAGCRQGKWTLWESYASRFIDGQGRVIDPADDRTTSEGQAYALFFALVNNDRARFDCVLQWTKDNLAQGDLGVHLPAWLWGKGNDGAWRTLDLNSASDSDTWFAYTLLEGGRLWDQPGYTKMARELMAQIARSEVADLPGFGAMLLPGPAGFVHKGTWTLNPSYLPAFVFERLAQADPAGPWRKIAESIPRFIRQSAVNGYAMDWVNYVPGKGFFPATHFADAKEPSGGSYDAIRVYLWAGMMDEKDPARAVILDALPSMATYLATHDFPPERISEHGIPSSQGGNVGFSAALMPYLKAMPGSGKALARQSIRMSAERDPESGLLGNRRAYYDQNLALFATGFLEKRFRFDARGELQLEWAHE